MTALDAESSPMGKKRSNPSFQPQRPLMTVLGKEPDRGIVLVSHAFLDYQIGERLKRFFESCVSEDSTIDDLDAGTIDRLLFGKPEEVDAIAGSFAIRVSLARVCGLIDRGTYRAMKELNGLRVRAAHAPSSFDLSAGHVERITEKLSNFGNERMNVIKSFIALDKYSEEMKDWEKRPERLEFAYTVLALSDLINWDAYEKKLTQSTG